MSPAKYYRLLVQCRIMPKHPGKFAGDFMLGLHARAGRELGQYFKDNPSTKADRLHRRAKFRRAVPVVLYLDANYLEAFEAGAWIDTPDLGRLVVDAGVIEIKNDDKYKSRATAEAKDAVNIWKGINDLYHAHERHQVAP